SLKSYTGLFQALRLLLPLPNLTTIHIHRCTPLEFFEELRGTRAPKITSLSVYLMSFNSALFAELCEIFSAVIRVKITVGDAEGAAENWDSPGFDPADYNWEIPALLEGLVKSLPRRIKHLALHWNVDFEGLSYTNESLPPFRIFAPVLMKKQRRLSALWLGMYGFTHRELKSANGKIAAKDDLVGQMDTHDVVKRIHKDFDLSWEVLGAHI
ncbi:hypothetical protein C8R46DRAFT_1133117, partial [Mycena filopes]